MFIKPFLIVFLFFTMAFSFEALPQENMDKVSLQLKWKHQFQFAGYYIAQKKGYYKEAGLNVTIIEAETNIDPLFGIKNGSVDFAVGTSEILILKEQGYNPVLLANIFQHSPVGFLTLDNGKVQNIHNLASQKIMFEDGSTELLAYLFNEGVDLNKLQLVENGFTADDLINGQVGSITAYSTDEPFELKERGIPYLFFTPIMSGLDFYGDNLFTTENQIEENPERVKAFLEASLKGWQYAMANKEEVIDLILSDYNTNKTREHLLFEALEMETLMMPEVVPIGFSSLERWEKIQTYYVNLGILSKKLDLSDFIYDPNPLGQELETLKEKTFYLTGTTLITTILSLLLIGFIIKFRSEITRRKIAEKNINLALNEAKVANQTKSAFIATISHEIRTPLTALIGTSQLLEDTKTNTVQKDLIGRLGRSGQFLLKLLNDILDFSKYETEKVHMEITPFDPSELIDDIFYMMQDRATQKELSLIKKCDPLPPLLMGDPFLIRQVLTNLIDNAIKFTIVGSVTIEVFYLEKNEDDEEAHLCFSIKDTGIGISIENQDSIFEAFKQEETGTSRRFGGSGLGLSICSQLIESMQGEIILESTKGEGSNFSFILMLPEAKENILKAVHPKDQKTISLNILLVDDVETNRLTISKLLESMGHNVETASSGEEAISKVVHNKYDLILMDIHMPEMDGIETAKKINELFLNHKSIPHIFAFTADWSPEAVEIYKFAGMLEIISKPFDKKHFNQILFKVFGMNNSIQNVVETHKSNSKSDILDSAVFDEFTELLSPEEFIKMLQSFEVNCKETLQQMMGAIKKGDANSLNEYIHRLSGASGIIGFKAIHNWCQSLRVKEQDPNWDDLILQIKIGEDLLQKSVEELNRK